MTRTTRALRPATVAPASIEEQHAQVVSALKHADAAQADASAALDAALAGYAATPTGDTAQAYADAYGRHIAMRDLAMQLRANEAEIAEAWRRHQQAGRERPKREAEEARLAAIRAVEQHPENAIAILRGAMRRKAVLGQPTITDDMLTAGLSKLVAKGGPGEPRFVARDIEEWTRFCDAHAGSIFGHGAEWALNRIRDHFVTRTGSDRIGVGEGTAQSGSYVGLQSGARS